LKNTYKAIFLNHLCQAIIAYNNIPFRTPIVLEQLSFLHMFEDSSIAKDYLQADP